MIRRWRNASNWQRTYSSSTLATAEPRASTLQIAGIGRALGSILAGRPSHRNHVSILTYHRICDEPAQALAEYAVAPRVLRRQLQILDWLGYRAVTIRALLDAFESNSPVGKTVVLTFDDGYLDTVERAAPLLKAAGVPATVFVIPGHAGGAATWDAKYGEDPAPLASWTQIRALREQGWEIGLHSMTHPNLAALSNHELNEEIAEAKAALERELGAPVETLAYPYSRHSPQVWMAAAGAGLRAAVAGESRRATRSDPRFALPRYTVLRSDSLLDFVLTVTIGRPLRVWRMTKPLRRASAKSKDLIGRRTQAAVRRLRRRR